MLLAVLGLIVAGCGARTPESPSVRVEAHSVTLTWNASVSPVSGYRVYRASSATADPEPLAVTNTNVTQYTDRTVEPGKTYFYSVKAYDSANRESVFSEKVSATVPAP